MFFKRSLSLPSSSSLDPLIPTQTNLSKNCFLLNLDGKLLLNQESYLRMSFDFFSSYIDENFAHILKNKFFQIFHTLFKEKLKITSENLDFTSSNFKLIRDDIFENRVNLLEDLMSPEHPKPIPKKRSPRLSKSKSGKNGPNSRAGAKGKKLFANLNLNLKRLKFLMLKLLYRNKSKLTKIHEQLSDIEPANRKRRRFKRKISIENPEVNNSTELENEPKSESKIRSKAKLKSEKKKQNPIDTQTEPFEEGSGRKRRAQKYMNRDLKINNLKGQPTKNAPDTTPLKRKGTNWHCRNSFAEITSMLSLHNIFLC